MCTGARYLGGLIKYDESKVDWLLYCTLKWENKNNTISKKADQKSYTTVVSAIQSQWILGTCNTIAMDTFATRDEKHVIYFCRSG